MSLDLSNSEAAALCVRLAALPSTLDEGGYECLQSEMEATAPALLLSAPSSYPNLPYAEMLADALVLQLSRTQAIDTLPPVFTDQDLAVSIATALSDCPVLRKRVPQYYQAALQQMLKHAHRE